MNTQIGNEVQAYLNANLRYQIIQVLREQRAEARPTFTDWVLDHSGIFGAAIITLFLILATIVIVIGIFATYKIEIAKREEEARICVETGYGCHSDTKNTDIQYHDTPIVEIDTGRSK